MKPLISIVILLIAFPACAADQWSKQDIALEITWLAVHAVDWAQTRYIADHPGTYYEQNPVFGKHPSTDKVDLMFLTGALVHIGITHFLPADYRPYFQSGTIGLSLMCIINNKSKGIGLNFSF